VTQRSEKLHFFCLIGAFVLFSGGLSFYFLDFPESKFWRLITIFLFQGSAFGILIWQIKKGYKIPILLIILVGILARITLLFSEPLLEDDYFRYMWDGRVFTNGINPYLYGPSDSALDHLDVDYRNKIGYKDVSTIYPPFTQFVFAIT